MTTPHSPARRSTLTLPERARSIGPRSCGVWWARGLVLPAGALAAAAFVAGVPGCGEALIDDNQERSQYDRYDALRDQRPPASVEDEFGNRKPNLRGRLLRRD